MVRCCITMFVLQFRSACEWFSIWSHNGRRHANKNARSWSFTAVNWRPTFHSKAPKLVCKPLQMQHVLHGLPRKRLERLKQQRKNPLPNPIPLPLYWHMAHYTALIIYHNFWNTFSDSMMTIDGVVFNGNCRWCMPTTAVYEPLSIVAWPNDIINMNVKREAFERWTWLKNGIGMRAHTGDKAFKMRRFEMKLVQKCYTKHRPKAATKWINSIISIEGYHKLPQAHTYAFTRIKR